MVLMAKAAKQYKEKELLSSSPEKIVLKLYDGAIGFIKLTIDNMEKNDIPKKVKSLTKAVDIIVYLRSCLDFEKGGEISDNLNRLYEYILVELAEGNLKNNTVKIGNTVELLTHIRDGWVEICKNKKESKDQMPGYSQQASTYNNSTIADQKMENFSAMA